MNWSYFLVFALLACGPTRVAPYSDGANATGNQTGKNDHRRQIYYKTGTSATGTTAEIAEEDYYYFTYHLKPDMRGGKPKEMFEQVEFSEIHLQVRWPKSIGICPFESYGLEFCIIKDGQVVNIISSPHTPISDQAVLEKAALAISAYGRDYVIVKQSKITISSTDTKGITVVHDFEDYSGVNSYDVGILSCNTKNKDLITILVVK